jgi:two-component system nitrogen regulation response regulator NtrX
MPHDILVVDDESDIRSLIAGILDDEGHQTRTAGDADGALTAMRGRVPSLVILDIWLQGSRLDGLELLEVVRRDFPLVPVVMISGHGTIETAVAAIKQGAYDFIEKPFQSDRLVLIVERAIEAARLKRENAELRLRANVDAEMVGVSAAIAQVRQQLERMAPTNSRVMIMGAPGVGKEVAARLLHQRSRRSNGPLIVVNCAAMHPDRLEIELFGSEGDGANPRKTGLFEQAHGGTLLLDEVADMPPETQGRILRTLQDMSFERTGGTTRVQVDVRVLASSNRDLEAEMAAGRLRQDLFYRLAVMSLRIPPLSDRRDDIPVLARHVARRFAESAGLPLREIGEDAMVALQSYDWPGNVRQLKNVIESLIIMAPGGRGPIRADMLPPEIGAMTPAVFRWDKGSEIMSLPLRDAREVFEREYLLAQVNRFGGNISRTASFILMERSALHRKLKTLGIATSDRAAADRGGEGGEGPEEGDPPLAEEVA